MSLSLDNKPLNVIWVIQSYLTTCRHVQMGPMTCSFSLSFAPSHSSWVANRLSLTDKVHAYWISRTSPTIHPPTYPRHLGHSPTSPPIPVCARDPIVRRIAVRNRLFKHQVLLHHPYLPQRCPPKSCSAVRIPKGYVWRGPLGPPRQRETSFMRFTSCPPDYLREPLVQRGPAGRILVVSELGTLYRR